MENKDLTQKEAEKRTERDPNEPKNRDVVQNEGRLAKLRGAVCDVCYAERQAFRGGAYLWRRPTMLERSACLWPVKLRHNKRMDFAMRGKGSIVWQRGWMRTN